MGLEWVSFIHEHKGVPVTPWNPGLGVASAVLVLRGPIYGLLLFVGVSIAEFFVLHTDLTAPIIVAMAAVISASFSPAAVVARRHLQLDVGLSHVRDVLVLLAVGTAAAAMSAVLASFAPARSCWGTARSSFRRRLTNKAHSRLAAAMLSYNFVFASAMAVRAGRCISIIVSMPKGVIQLVASLPLV